MKVEMREIEAIQLVGKPMRMSLNQNFSADLWRSAVPILKKVTNRISEEFISLQHYPADYFTRFNPDTFFEKWACVAVKNVDSISQELESFHLPGGLYAVFHYRGMSGDPSVFNYIFSSWLPDSGFELDQRPHFEVLGARYRNNDPNSEEEIWIPVKPVTN